MNEWLLSKKREEMCRTTNHPCLEKTIHKWLKDQPTTETWVGPLSRNLFSKLCSRRSCKTTQMKIQATSSMGQVQMEKIDRTHMSKLVMKQARPLCFSLTQVLAKSRKLFRMQTSLSKWLTSLNTSMSDKLLQLILNQANWQMQFLKLTRDYTTIESPIDRSVLWQEKTLKRKDRQASTNQPIAQRNKLRLSCPKTTIYLCNTKSQSPSVTVHGKRLTMMLRSIIKEATRSLLEIVTLI